MEFLKCACMETLYTELPFLDRFRAAKEDGFAAVEFWSWADKDLEAVRAAAGQAAHHADIVRPDVFRIDFGKRILVFPDHDGVFITPQHENLVAAFFQQILFRRQIEIGVQRIMIQIDHFLAASLSA